MTTIPVDRQARINWMRQLRMRSSDRISGAGRSRFHPGDWWGQGFKGGDLRSKYYPALDAATGERPSEGECPSQEEKQA